MKVYAMWYGGLNYAAPSACDVEEFSSLKSAKDAFYSRQDSDPYYPCVENSEMQIFYGDPAAQDFYPDLMLTMGPRGGIKVERV